ncbi:hypothetical protein Tco_0345264 [Tanacetum coccineum]
MGVCCGGVCKMVSMGGGLGGVVDGVKHSYPHVAANIRSAQNLGKAECSNCKFTCERGDVVLRTSRKHYSYGKQYYACPFSKMNGGYFMWMDDLTLHISSSSGSSTPPSYSPGTSTRPSYSPGTSTRPSYSSGSSRSAQNLGKAECSNCKFLAEKIKTLEAKIKILEGALEMERYPEKHILDSAAILHELYNEMGKLSME